MLFKKRVTTCATLGIGVCIGTVAWWAPNAPSAATASTIAADRGKLTDSDVQLILRFDKSELELNDEVTIEVALVNDSDEAIYVARTVELGILGGVVLHIQDVNGRAVQSPFIFDVVPLPPKEEDPDLFVRLEPSHFLGSFGKGKARDLFPTVGRFSVFATYVCPLSKESDGSKQRQVRTVWRETGRFKSRSITVNVR